eukprot:PhF_6_TR17372/c0_g1_i1/m.26603
MATKTRSRPIDNTPLKQKPHMNVLMKTPAAAVPLRGSPPPSCPRPPTTTVVLKRNQNITWEEDDDDFQRAVACATPITIPYAERIVTRILPSHKLNATWTFWIDSWVCDKPSSTPELRRISLGSFHTVEGFWRYAAHIDFRKLPRDSTVQLFRKGMLPNWESHPDGGQFKLYKVSPTPTVHSFAAGGMGAPLWDDLMLGMVGESMPHSQSVIGAGVCPRDSSSEIYKVWVRDQLDEKTIQDLRWYLAMLRPGYDSVFKPHTMLIHESRRGGGYNGRQPTSPITPAFSNGDSFAMARPPTSAPLSAPSTPIPMALLVDPDTVPPLLPVPDIKKKRQSTPHKPPDSEITAPTARDPSPPKKITVTKTTNNTCVSQSSKTRSSSGKKGKKDSTAAQEGGNRGREKELPKNGIKSQQQQKVVPVPKPPPRPFLQQRSQRILEVLILVWFLFLTCWIFAHKDLLGV